MRFFDWEIGQENKQLIETVKDYKRLRGVIVEKQTDNIIAAVKAEEQARKRPVRSRGLTEDNLL